MFPIHDNMPRRCLPVVTWSLIGINALIFLAETSLPAQVLERLLFALGVVPARFSGPSGMHALLGPSIGYFSFISCMFLHGGWIHVIGNMWTLWIFGDNVEDVMGPWRFLAFYLLAGIGASVLHVLTNPGSTVPIIGASGAIAGVMGAYYTLFPRARIVMMVPIFIIPFFFEIPAVFFLAFWFVQQVMSGTLSIAAAGHAGGIAWWAHVGGFIIGALLNRPFLIGRRRMRRNPYL